MAWWQLYNWANPIANVMPQTVKRYGPGEEDPQRVDFQRRDLASMGEYDSAVDEWYDRIQAGHR